MVLFEWARVIFEQSPCRRAPRILAGNLCRWCDVCEEMRLPTTGLRNANVFQSFELGNRRRAQCDFFGPRSTSPTFLHIYSARGREHLLPTSDMKHTYTNTRTYADRC